MTKPRATWKISKGRKDDKSSSPKEKLMPHLKELPITDDMAEGTRNFALQYNAMRAVLIENKLMKAK